MAECWRTTPWRTCVTAKISRPSKASSPSSPKKRTTPRLPAVSWRRCAYEVVGADPRHGVRTGPPLPGAHAGRRVVLNARPMAERGDRRVDPGAPGQHVDDAI